MKRRHIALMVFATASIAMADFTMAQQGSRDRNSLMSASGISFSEIKGYERWQMVGVSQADGGYGCSTSPDPGCIKGVLGNAVLIKALGEGIPRNGKPVPDGAVFAKIEWAKERNTDAGYPMTVPGNLAEVGVMMKDSKRFPERNGWGYARFIYNPGSDTWTSFGDGPEFQNTCHGCHTVVKSRDFVYTHFPKR